MPSKECCRMTEGELKDMLVLVRNTKGGPPHCSCSDCERKRESEKETSHPLLMVTEWNDYRSGDTFPNPKKVIKALNRALNTKKGPQEQYIALWYHFGSAVMGRAWCCRGKIAAAFVRCSLNYPHQWLDSTMVGKPIGKPQRWMKRSGIQYTSHLTHHVFLSSTMKDMNTWVRQTLKKSTHKRFSIIKYSESTVVPFLNLKCYAERTVMIRSRSE
ncbi:hypothetical protein Tcan_04414 [Toxocara canis]|uniref:Uncharacterized protein n=1 Tax=Toxocara canis TaxID=6265 RepID=A0A0B2VRJ8_TOXCA|nr:hypothetical protein Tcan_04414 [Toxocara canis]